MSINFPSNPSSQTPTNTFSPTSTPSATSNGITYTYDGTKWVASSSGGGGGGSQDLQSVTDEGSTTTNGASFGGGNVTLNANGSISNKALRLVDDVNNTWFYAPVNLNSVDYVFATKNQSGTSAVGTGLWTAGVTKSGVLNMGDLGNGGNVRIALDGSDGSATFAGTVRSKGAFVSDGYDAFSYLFQGFNAGGAETVKIFSTGNATFAGTITANNVTFNLEADDDTKYTATTNEDGEQTLVYNGAVLDVKERIQNVLARMDAMEANEVTDDSTDSALLTLVANLSSRLDERDLQIAALTARVTTLELP